jgi:hypothetical protein
LRRKTRTNLQKLTKEINSDEDFLEPVFPKSLNEGVDPWFLPRGDYHYKVTKNSFVKEVLEELKTWLNNSSKYYNTIKNDVKLLREGKESNIAKLDFVGFPPVKKYIKTYKGIIEEALENIPNDLVTEYAAFRYKKTMKK